MNIVILAAGLGKRMHSKLPKVLQKVAGKPMLAHVLETARRIPGDNRIVVVLGHGMQQVKQALDLSSETCAVQDRQLGTGHALKCALAHLNPQEPTLVLYGDVPFISGETLERFFSQTQDKALGILTVRLADPTGYGRIVRQDGAVARIVEERDATPQQKAIGEVNTGIMLLPAGRVGPWLEALPCANAQGEYYLTDVVGLAVSEGCAICTTQVADALEVAGANSKEQLAALERGYQRMKARALMASGTTLVDPERIDIRGTLSCESDVEIDVGCVFEGDVRLAQDVRVGPYVYLKDAEIGPGTEILPFSHIEGARVGASCRIGPFARIRPGTELEGQNHIGDFVEIKKSRIGLQSKVNHLSYIGDTDMGRKVNIGAGTITCNYDGLNKFRTTIGSEAFIGSGTELVAPVAVGDGATVGAGTTLTRDAPAGKLTVGRARQTTVEGWVRPEKRQKG